MEYILHLRMWVDYCDIAEEKWVAHLAMSLENVLAHNYYMAHKEDTDKSTLDPWTEVLLSHFLPSDYVEDEHRCIGQMHQGSQTFETFAIAMLHTNTTLHSIGHNTSTHKVKPQVR